MTETTAKKIQKAAEDFISKILLAAKEDGLKVDDWYFEKDNIDGKTNLLLYVNGCYQDASLLGSDFCSSITISQGV